MWVVEISREEAGDKGLDMAEFDGVLGVRCIFEDFVDTF